jgi:hypothetical protein
MTFRDFLEQGSKSTATGIGQAGRAGQKPYTGEAPQNNAFGNASLKPTPALPKTVMSRKNKPRPGSSFEGKTDQDRYIEMSEINNTQHSINQYTMDIAVNILEKSWLWRFRSAKKKLEMVAEMYHHLTEMI